MEGIEDERTKTMPFCGGKANFERIGNRKQSCIVACEDCGCTLESNEESESCGDKWNRRSSEDIHNSNTASFYDID